MTVDQIDVEATIKKGRQLLAEEAHLSSALLAAAYSTAGACPIDGKPFKPE